MADAMTLKGQTGNLTEDPKLTYTPGGTPVTELKVASTERTFNRKSNAWEDDYTLFFDLKCFGALAENVAASLKKGDPIIYNGKMLQPTAYISKRSENGEPVARIRVQASQVGPDLSHASVNGTIQRNQRQNSNNGGGQQNGSYNNNGQQNGGQWGNNTGGNWDQSTNNNNGGWEQNNGNAGNWDNSGANNWGQNNNASFWDGNQQ